jgi:hypothetical protein
VSIAVSKRISRLRELLKLIEDFGKEIEALCERIVSFGEKLHGRIEEAIRKYCRVVESKQSSKGSAKLYECVKDNVKFYAVTFTSEEEWLRTITEDKEEAEREFKELLKKL